MRLGAGGEGRPLHADVASPLVHGSPHLPGSPVEDVGELAADGVRELDVADHAVSEEGVLAGTAGAVDELVRNHDVPGDDLLLQAPHRRDGDDAGDAELLHAVDVGAVVHLGGGEAVSLAMARQEDHLHAVKGTGDVFVAGPAERGIHGDLAHPGHPFHLVKSAAADHTYYFVSHSFLPASLN